MTQVTNKQVEIRQWDNRRASRVDKREGAGVDGGVDESRRGRQVGDQVN